MRTNGPINKPLQHVCILFSGALFLLTMVMLPCEKGVSADDMKDVTFGDYIKTVQSGIKTLPWPKQIESLFGDADHLITDYGLHPGPRIWTTEVFFYGRYSLAAQFKVEIDYQHCQVVTNTSPPKFYLYEVESLTTNAGEIDGARIAHQWTFDEAKWAALLQAKGNWSAIGIPVKTNSPLAGFDEYVKGEREPRIKIPH